MYQPIVSLDTGRSCRDGGARAVACIRAAGCSVPGQFIPLAEETGLIVEIGEWILREACRQAKAWDTKWHPRGCRSASRSTSPVTNCKHPEVVDRRAACAGRSGCARTPRPRDHRERADAAHRDDARAADRAQEPLVCGSPSTTSGPDTRRSAICSGSRSTSSRSRSRSWTMSGRASGHPALARAIIALGETLSLRTIAEGIEVRSQAEALRALGCELGQGYYYSTPLIVEQMQHLIEHHAGEPLPLVRTARTPRGYRRA